MDARSELGRLADEIEAELRALGSWQAEPLPAETIAAGGAFGQASMAFTQWLQFVLVPRLREVAAGAAPIPESSSLGAQAVREFDTWPQGQHLAALLAEVDDVVDPAAFLAIERGEA